VEAQNHFLLFQTELPRSVRRAIWIVGTAALWLLYLAMGGMALYGFALWYVTGNFTYTLIPTFAMVWEVLGRLGPADWSEDEDSHPLTPGS
jgi:hypothetical protein